MRPHYFIRADHSLWSAFFHCQTRATVCSILLLFYALLQGSCTAVPEYHFSQRNDSALALARNGDIILRCGRDELSKLFCRLNVRNQLYSHCGILNETDSGLYVTHIIGGSDNPGGRIRYEPVQSFIRPEQQLRWALVRYELDAEAQERFENSVRLVLEQHIRFDAAFDLATDDRMYCSELVYKTLLQATGDSSYIGSTRSSTGREYIAIDNLFDNVHSKTVCAISYK